MEYKKLEKIRLRTSPILPTVYEDSLSYIELLNKLIKYLDTYMENVDDINEYVHDFVNTYDSKLKPFVIEGINALYESGVLAEIINKEINKGFFTLFKIFTHIPPSFFYFPLILTY